jgi:hypothetical protein
VLLNYAQSLNGIPVLSWLGEFASALKDRDLTSWSLVSGLFGARFEIWEGALRMWWEFPLMGVGQGNFYRLSDIASFSKSHYLILNGGENAHNYFLQTLTETGLIGITIFSLALIAPLISSINKKALVPAVVALVSLFLGNIFAHSFLVRENLLIAAILFGLIYLINYLQFRQFIVLILVRIKRIRGISELRYFWLAFMLLTIFLILKEVAFAYGRNPFEYGRLCFINKPLEEDGWTSGKFEISMPLGSHGVSLNAYLPLSNKISIEKELGGNLMNYEILNITRSLNNASEYELKFELPDNQVINIANFKVQVTAPRCYTPRNFGINVDGRRLGIKISSPIKSF